MASRPTAGFRKTAAVVALGVLVAAVPSLAQPATRPAATEPAVKALNAVTPDAFVERALAGPAGKSGASLRLPPNWVERPTDLALLYGAPKSVLNVNVVVGGPAPAWITPEELARRLPAIVKQQAPAGAEISPVEVEVVTIGAQKAARSTFSVRDDQMHVRMAQYHVLSRAHSYVITFTALERDFAGAEQTFEQVMMSAKLP